MDAFRGKQKFDREQLIFVAEVAINAALSTIEVNLGHQMSDSPNLTPDQAQEIIQPALSQLGWTLSIFYAKLTGGSMGVDDAIGILLRPHPFNLDDVVQDFGLSLAKGGKGGSARTHAREYALFWTDRAFPHAVD